MDVRNGARAVFLGREDGSFYAENAAAIDAENQAAVRAGCLAGLVLTGLSACAALANGQMRPLLVLYLAGAGVYAAGTLLSWAVLRGATGWGLAGVCVFAGFADLHAALLGTLGTPNAPAAVFYTVVFAVSALIFARPVWALSFSAGALAVFCALSAWAKAASPLLVREDAANALFTLVLCVCADSWLLGLRCAHLRADRLFQALGETDRLTGLASRAAMEQLCRGYLTAGRTQACALLIVDLDDFNEINDTLGQTAGDEVLLRTGEALRALFREGDIVGRLSGDEFLVLMKNIAGPDAAMHKADQVRLALGAILPAGRPLTCSIGVAAAAAGDGVSFTELFSRADTALYGSKSTGKNRSTTYRVAEQQEQAR